MFGNLSTKQTEGNYAISDSQLPFLDYIAHHRALIEERRLDIQKGTESAEHILEINSPFELYPKEPIYAGKKLKYGVLLIHGLLDSPFSLKDIGLQLQQQGMLVRAILLPGHGTTPRDLMHVTYQDWIKAVQYGIETLKQEVGEVFLIGYSTGATLAVYQALKDPTLKGIVLLSPAIKIKAPVNIVVAWNYLVKFLMHSHNPWISKEEECDLAKYKSVTFNSVHQVDKLIKVTETSRHQHDLRSPMLMIISREDETISSHRAIDFFSSFKHENSKLLLYTAWDHLYPDKRIMTRVTHYPELQIKHFSHASLPFSPANKHYGKKGEYLYASRPYAKNFIYGAYNRVEINLSDVLNKLGILKCNRRELTYNPDFEFMTDTIYQFINGPI